MLPRRPEDIRKEWKKARPHALILGSAATAHSLIEAIGVASIRALRAVVPIGPTTASALGEHGIAAEPPARAIYPAVIERLVKLRARRDGALPKSEVG